MIALIVCHAGLEAFKAGGFKAVKDGQNHVAIGESELQECMEGISNVNVNEEEASVDLSIQTREESDGDSSHDGVALVIFTMPSTKALTAGKEKFNCGASLLCLNSAGEQSDTW